MNHVEVPETDLRITQIIWFAMVMSLMIYGVIAWMAIAEPRSTGQSLGELFNDPKLMILTLLAIASLAIALLSPRFFVRPGQASSIMRVRQILIIQYAFAESVAIYGLVASFLYRDIRPFLIFGAVALATFLMLFPSRARIEERLRAPM